MIYELLCKISYFNDKPLQALVVAFIIYILAHAYLYSDKCIFSGSYMTQGKSFLYVVALGDIASFYNGQFIKNKLKDESDEKNNTKTKKSKDDIVYRKKKQVDEENKISERQKILNMMKQYGSNMLNKSQDQNKEKQNDPPHKSSDDSKSDDNKNVQQNQDNKNEKINIFVKNPETSKYKSVEEINEELMTKDGENDDANLTIPAYQSKNLNPQISQNANP